jgi:hypothetical protein
MKSLLPPLMKIIEIYSIHLFKLKHIIKSLKVVINEYIVTCTIKCKSKTKSRNIYVLLYIYIYSVDVNTIHAYCVYSIFWNIIWSKSSFSPRKSQALKKKLYLWKRNIYIYM